MSLNAKGKVKTFIVFEVQEVVQWRKYRYEIAARSKEEALELIEAGKAEDVEDFGMYGDESFKKSGFSFEDWANAAKKLREKE